MTDLLVRRVRTVPLQGGELPGEPVDLRLRGGRVVEVGPELSATRGSGGGEASGAPEVIDGDGRWVIPGIWDQHTHLGQWTLAQQRVDTSGCRDGDDLLRLVADRLGDEIGRPLIGWGHRPGTWTRQPTVSELDAVSGVTPVVLIAGDAHHAWLNSIALAALLLAPREGVVRETEWFAAYERLQMLVDDDGVSPAAYRATLERAAARGVVGVVDFEFTGGVDDWVQRWTSGADVVRVRMATYAEGLEKVIARGLRSGDPLPAGDPRLTMGPLKIISDGSLNTRSAWCCDPYADADELTEPNGAANLDDTALVGLLARAHMSGIEVATHAIGDRAVTAALDAYQLTGASGSIEHAQLIAHRDAARMAALGIRASVQPAHLLDDRDLTEHLWPGRSERCFAFRWLLDAGVELVLGSDAPVSPLDPWLAMAAAVHRSADDRPAWHDEHALSVQEALASSVDRQPRVGLGSLADLVLLDADPLAPAATPLAQAQALRGIGVALTVIDGQVAHRALP